MITDRQISTHSDGHSFVIRVLSAPVRAIGAVVGVGFSLVAALFERNPGYTRVQIDPTIPRLTPDELPSDEQVLTWGRVALSELDYSRLELAVDADRSRRAPVSAHV